MKQYQPCEVKIILLKETDIICTSPATSDKFGDADWFMGGEEQ